MGLGEEEDASTVTTVVSIRWCWLFDGVALDAAVEEAGDELLLLLADSDDDEEEEAASASLSRWRMARNFLCGLYASSIRLLVS